MTQPLIQLEQINNLQLLALIDSQITSILLTDISDILITVPAIGDVLTYVGGSPPWRNAPNAGTTIQSGDGITAVALASPETTTLVSVDATVARRDATNLFTQTMSGVNTGPIVLQSGAPGIIFDETDAGSPTGRIWRFFAASSDLFFDVRDAANTTSTNWLEVNRTGTTVDAIRLSATTVSLGGSPTQAETTTPALGGLLAQNLATGTGLERVLTTSDLQTGSPSNDALGDLTDVTITGSPRGIGSPIVGSPLTGDLLYHNGTEWVNTAGELTWNSSNLTLKGSNDVTIVMTDLSAFTPNETTWVLRSTGNLFSIDSRAAGGDISGLELLRFFGSPDLLEGIIAYPGEDAFQVYDRTGNKFIFMEHLLGRSFGQRNAARIGVNSLTSDTDNILFGSNTLDGGWIFEGSNDPANGLYIRHGRDLNESDYAQWRWPTATKYQLDLIGGPDTFQIHSELIVGGSPGAVRLQTISAATGGLEVDNQLTGTGLERVLTISDLQTGSPADDALGDLTDVTITGSPANNNDLLYHNGSAWVNTVGKLTWNGELLTLSGSPAPRIILPLEDDAATPTLAFGDGDSGFYESADDTIAIAIAGGIEFEIDAATGIHGAITNGPALLNENSSGSNPTVVPNKTQPTSGMGIDSQWLHMVHSGSSVMQFKSVSGEGIIQINPDNLRTAVPGGAQGSSGRIDGSVTYFDTVATHGDSGTLNNQGYDSGTFQIVFNNGEKNLRLWPNENVSLGPTRADNVPIHLRPGDGRIFMRAQQSDWNEVSHESYAMQDLINVVIGSPTTETKNLRGGGSPDMVAVAGDILIYSTAITGSPATVTPNWINLARGTAGQVLTLGSPFGVPSWVTGTGQPDQDLWLSIGADSGGPVSANTTTDTITLTGGTSITTSISGDVVTFTNDAPNVDQNLWLTVAADTGGPVSANTTTDTLTLAGANGIVTSISGDTVTITMSGSPLTDLDQQNIFSTITVVGSPTVVLTADSTATNVTFIAGTGITLVTVGSPVGSPNTITITNATPNVDQNLFLNVLSDAGTATADTTTDTLSILGGTSISTSVTDDALTIVNDDPNVDQNLWATIAADAGGPVSANTTTDTLTLAGAGGVRTSISGDTVTITMTGSPFGSGSPVQAALGDLTDVVITTLGSPNSGSPLIPATGDVLYFDGTNWVNLERGTAGQVLTLGSPFGVPSWVAAAGGSPVTTALGDLTDVDLTGTETFDLLFRGSPNWTHTGGNLKWNSTREQLLVPATGSPFDAGKQAGEFPALAFGNDGDIGFFAIPSVGSPSHMIGISLNNSLAWTISPTDGIEGSNSSGPQVLNEASSGNNPTLVPNKTDPDTGLGGEGSDFLHLIAGGVSMLRMSEANSAGLLTWTMDNFGTASITQTQGQDQLRGSYNELNIVANDDDTSTAPAAGTGAPLVIINNGANRLQVFPTSGDSLGFGVDNPITIDAGKARQWFAATNVIFTPFQPFDLQANNAAGPEIIDRAATSSVPTLIPNRADTGTGIGWSATSNLSLVAKTIDIGDVGSPIASIITTTTVIGSPNVQTTIETYSATKYRSAEFLIQATTGSPAPGGINVHITKIIAIHDGTTADSTEFGTVTLPSFIGSPATGSPGNSGIQATYAVDMGSPTGSSLRLLATPVGSPVVSNPITVKVAANLITI